jgi:hypothetical protein
VARRRKTSRRRTPAARRLTAGLAVLAVAALGATAWLVHRPAAPERAVAGCSATADGVTVELAPSQARNATTLAAVAARDGLPSHAVTVALATVLQESGLENLSYGDRDSLGLFQQRPSQGWGTPAQVRDPAYAARTFYRRLVKVPGWQRLPVTVAAQRVQRSAFPDAYAAWEPTARVLARALTGQAPGGFTCSALPAATQPRDLARDAARELGSASLLGPRPARTGWTTAAWVVARSGQARVDTVSFAGRTWTSSSGRWTVLGPPAEGLAVHVAPARAVA